jgi:hypothetical protein
MIQTVLQVLFRCAHRHMTRPITSVDPGSASGPYVVCLDCGAALAYDWENMRVSRTKVPASKRPAA